MKRTKGMIKGTLRFLLFAVLCVFCTVGVRAATSLFSDYGQIQNVQNYSSNPFWTPNSPYNQRLPQPVYVQGADLTAEDCFKVVQSLVSVQCMARDNCKNTSLAEIRPTVMVQLSNLPGNNYVSACSGFIDGVFESYVAQYGTNIPNRAVAFPKATEKNQNLNNNNIQIQNPYKQTTPTWQQEIKERSQELQELQQQNGADSEHLSAADFPLTYEDLTFSERLNLAAADYAQYKDMDTYVVPDFKNKKEWCEGKGAGTAECKKYEQQQAQNNQQTTPNKPTPPSNQPDYPQTKEKSYSAKVCYYPKGLISRKCTNSRVSTGENWLGKLCVSFCDIDPITDDLNTKILFPVMKKKYCIDSKKDFEIVEQESHKPIIMNEKQYEQVKAKIASDLADKGACDGGYLKLDILIGQANSGHFVLTEQLKVDE